MKCEHCGKEFEPSHGNQRFCSRQCCHWNSYNYKGRPTIVKTCEHCGAEFETAYSFKKYCSRACCQAAYEARHNLKARRGELKTCPYCGGTFKTRGRNHIYCSKGCCRAMERKRERLKRLGIHHIPTYPMQVKAIEPETATPETTTPIEEVTPPEPEEPKVIIPAAIAENRAPTVDELIEWIFSKERSA